MPTYQSPPAWFRYVVIAASTLLLCSCSALQREPLIRGQSPDAALPTHLTATQVRRASAPIASRPVDMGCPCCSSLSGCAPGCCPPPGSSGDEWLCDGGDFGLPAGVRADWSIDGLEREDSIAHYDTIDGRTVVTPSNQVCIYAPRFGVVRKVIDVRQYNQFVMPGGAIQQAVAVPMEDQERPATRLAQTEPILHRLNQPPSLFNERQQPGELDQEYRAAAALGSPAPSANLQVVRTGEVSQNEKVVIARSSLAALSWTAVQGPQIAIQNLRAKAEVSLQQPGVIYQTTEPNSPKLRLIKLASTDHALPGEEVEFTFRFDNVGDRVIGNVTIVDHLTTRLELIEKSQKSTLESNFSTSPSEQGSLVLRWEIIDPIEPGQGGVIQFRTRVR
mgnify:CR=1 FL=1